MTRPAATAGTMDRGRLTPELEAALADRILETTRPLAEAGKLATFLLQLSPAFRPGDHELDELAPLLARLAPHPVAVEVRHRAWLGSRRIEGTLDWLEAHAAAFVGVDAPQGKAPTLIPPVDAGTRHDVAYLRG